MKLMGVAALKLGSFKGIQWLISIFYMHADLKYMANTDVKEETAQIPAATTSIKEFATRKAVNLILIEMETIHFMDLAQITLLIQEILLL